MARRLSRLPTSSRPSRSGAGAPAAARAAAERLGDPATVAVVTGQQAGAFGGPLFTLLKAVTAIQLARRVSADQGVSAVAVFWVDAEDHDWEEVRSCTVLDADFQPASVTLADPQGAGELPVAALTLDDRIEQSLAALSALPARHRFFRHGARRRCGLPTSQEQGWRRRSRNGSKRCSDLTASSSSSPRIRRRNNLQRRCSCGSCAPGATSSLALAAGQQLHDRGHEPQVMPQPDSLALFHFNGVRRAIRRQGEHFVDWRLPGHGGGARA